MTVITYEGGERARVAAEELKRELSGVELELWLLAIPSTDGKKIRGGGSYEELIASVGEGSAVVGYALPRELRLGLLGRGAAVLDLCECESFLEENAALTATAALGILLTSEARAPSELRVGVVGYGRIGRRLLTLLALVGASVKLYTTSEKRAIELGEEGVDVELICPGCDFSGVDVLINTAPAPLFDALLEMHDPPRIMELASGENFAKGIAVEKYPSLPARVYPESAGGAVASAVLDFLRGEGFI